MTPIPSAGSGSDSYSCTIVTSSSFSPDDPRARHHRHHVNIWNSKAIQIKSTCPSSESCSSRCFSHSSPCSDSRKISSGSKSCMPSSCAVLSPSPSSCITSKHYLFPPSCSIRKSPTHMSRMTCSLLPILLVIMMTIMTGTITAIPSDHDPSDMSKYSFNGFAGGLTIMSLAGNDSSSNNNNKNEDTESLLFKRSTTDDDFLEALPSASALRVEEKMIMPEISLPTVTVRGFLNFRTTVDGTVIVFTPSSAAGSPSASQVTNPSMTEGNSMQVTSAMRISHHQPFSYRTQERSQYHRSSAEIDATPVQRSSSSNVYPTGVVSVIADTNTGDDGTATIQETKVIGTYIEGKYAQILRSSSYVSTPIIPSGTFAVYAPEVSPTVSKKIELRRPILARNSIHPRYKPADQREKSEAVNRFTRGDRDRDESSEGPTEATTNADGENSRTKLRKPVGRLPGSGAPGRLTWNRPVSERVRLNRFKIKVNNGEQGSSGSSGGNSRFTARDENDREAAKLLNQRLNRRLGISRATPPENRSPVVPAVVLDPESKSNNDEDNGSRSRSGYDLPLMEGMLAGGSFNPQLQSSQGQPHVVTDITTFTSEVTRGFAGGEPLIETVTMTSAIERTIDSTPAATAGASDSVTLASGMMQMLPDGMLLQSSSVNQQTPDLPVNALVITKTFTMTESSSRTSLYPVTDGPIATTHTIVENFIIRKLITAYKTIPAGDQNSGLFSSIASEMNNADYMEGLIGSENILNPSMFQGTLDLSITPTSSAGNMRPTDVPLLHPSLNLGSSNNHNNILNHNGNINGIIGPQIDLNNPLVLGAALQNPTLAAMYFGLQQLSQQATQYTTIYKPTETLTTELVYSTKTLSFYDGRQTRTRTITDPASTVTKLVTATVTDIQPVINPQVLVQQAQLQRAFASQLLNGQQQQQQSNPNGNSNNFNLNSMNLFASPTNQNQNQVNNNNNNILLQQRTSQNAALLPQQNNNNNNNNNNQLFNHQIRGSLVTESITSVTSATATSTKIYTLIYNALSTKFRTVTSTSVFPTTVTEIITKTITPTASFNFFG